MEPPRHTPRIGTFFQLVGLILLILFLGSGFSKQPVFPFLLGSLVAFIIGFLFRRNVPRSSSGRFGMVRKAHESLRARKEEKKK
jgi:hypothetical protein